MFGHSCRPPLERTSIIEKSHKRHRFDRIVRCASAAQDSRTTADRGWIHREEQAMTATRTFPLNAWYAAAWSHEIVHALAARTVCGHPIVLYRRSDNLVAALEDSCWHRLFPLSMGHLKGDEVMCGYHGLVFNAAGRCTYMPAQKTINPSACVRAYPVAERHRLVWIWPGDPALADPAKIPDFHWNDGTDWIGEGGTFYQLKCDYRLVIDNLMDLTHETYVHAGSIGDEAI